MRLIAVSLWVGVAAAARLAAGLLVAKLVAVFAGPAGMGVFGQFQSLVSLATSFANGGISQGTLSLAARHRDDPAEAQRYAGTSIAIAAGVSAAGTLAFAALAGPIAARVLGDESHAGAVRWLAAAFIPLGATVTLQALLNGVQRLPAYFATQLAGNAVTAALAGWLVPRQGLEGALLALAFAQIILGVVTVAVAVPALRPLRLVPRFDAGAGRALAGFSAMAITSAISVPACHILIRDHLATTISPEAAGWWHALSRLSDAYLLFFTSILSAWYLPRLAATTERAALSRLVRRAAMLLVPTAAAVALLLYVARDSLIMALFSASFLPIAALFPFQFAGDVLKIASWTLSYLMVAKARSRLFVATEIAFSASFVVLVMALTPAWGVQGAAIAHAANYAAYLALMVVLYRTGRFA